MRGAFPRLGALISLLAGSLLVLATMPALGQVNPVEMLDPQLRADEGRYLPQLASLHQSIADTKFPVQFSLARYLNAKTRQRASMDFNGIEFVNFQHRVILKISGRYKGAFNRAEFSENERATRTLQDVIAPILQLVIQQIPRDVDCDGIGFEILYNTRGADGTGDYEGREVLVVVFNRDDAFAYSSAAADPERQVIIDRSEVFVNAKEIALSLSRSDLLNAESHARSRPATPPAARVERALVSTSPAGSKNSFGTSGDVDPWQMRVQSQFNAISEEGAAKIDPADSASPFFENADGEVILRFTVGNTLMFDVNKSSIYKRAAQSFDLFLAPQLKDMLRKIPAGTTSESLDFAVLNHLGAEQGGLEKIDYVCPLEATRSLVNNKITTQDLINKCVVMVNGVRIGLDLQLVE